VHVSLSLTELQERCSRLAGEAFRRDGELRTMPWVTKNVDGALSEFDMPCSAPSDVSDAAALAALCAEQRADFAHDRIIRYALAFVGRVTFVGVGLAILAQPPSCVRRVVVVEAHDARASLVGTRDIVVGEWPRLGPLQRHQQATARFGGLLAARAERDVRRRGG
jgi:hypothetical protein